MRLWNKFKLKLGHKFYCKYCFYFSSSDNTCKKNIISCDSTWLDYFCKYEKCEKINKDNNCLDFDASINNYY